MLDSIIEDKKFANVMQKNIENFYEFIENLKIPDNISFEYVSEQSNKRNEYHNKIQSNLKEGLQLYHIFDYQWESKPDIIKSIINSKVGTYATKISARKCDIRIITNKERLEKLIILYTLSRLFN